jgi:endogenous inhibitor of DNA gyrase (YacG/DUF329 family)
LQRAQNAPSSAAGQTVQSLDLSAMNAAMKTLENPASAVERPNRMLTSELRVFCVECGKAIPYNSEQCPFCGKDQPKAIDDRDGDGMKDAYEVRWGFNPDDPDDSRLDADGDGFTNGEECNAGTSPKDKALSPPIIAKLRVERLQQARFRLRFEAVQEVSSGTKFQLNATDRSYFLRVGESAEGYTILKHDKTANILTLQQGDRQIGLPYRKDIIDDLITVHFRFLLDGKTFSYSKDGEFDLRGKKFRLTEIISSRPAAVKVVEVSSGKEFIVNAMTPADQTEMQNRLHPDLRPAVPPDGKNAGEGPGMFRDPNQGGTPAARGIR